MLGELVLQIGIFQVIGALVHFDAIKHYQWGPVIGPGLLALAGFIVHFAGLCLRPPEKDYENVRQTWRELGLDNRANRVHAMLLKSLLFLSGWAVVYLLYLLHADSWAGAAVAAVTTTFTKSAPFMQFLLMALVEPLHPGRDPAPTKAVDEVPLIQRVNEARRILGLRDVSSELRQARARRADLERRLLDDRGPIPDLVVEWKRALAEEGELSGFQEAWSGEPQPEPETRWDRNVQLAPETEEARGQRHAETSGASTT